MKPTTIACPTCGAPVGQPCRRPTYQLGVADGPTGHEVLPYHHAARVDAAFEEISDLVRFLAKKEKTDAP